MLYCFSEGTCYMELGFKLSVTTVTTNCDRYNRLLRSLFSPELHGRVFKLLSAFDPQNGVVTAPVNATPEQLTAANESKLRDLKVKNYLFQSIDRSILETILNRETSKDIWEAMCRKYQGSTKVKRAQLQSLRREFEVLAMGEDESVNDYFARTLAIANRLTAQGKRMEQVVVVEKIMRSMPAKFNYVVCAIEEATDVTTMSIDELQSSLLVQEERMKGQQIQAEAQALKWEGNGNANYAELKEEEGTLLMAYCHENVETKQELWYIDSGCSNHMVRNKEWVFDFDDKFRESVKLGNDSKMAVMGRGCWEQNPYLMF
ncbi:hypothetical protein TSUD_394540 [Trifolium subterraneum]|uniref:Retrovirus-related Pol polyprotein from transposon TNT 1-94-like beta-barrel domain-containing protein n=1 Tax=Trifolium subterraneum TaxID=3900 RepID=A0A2Z6NXM7_TRISU|nr:hypothetical protein TSUD_394540 [Trifolium subterraneum]